MNSKNILGIGIVGCGKISGIYFENLTRRFPWLEVRACSDLVPERAREKADQFGVAVACSTEELLDRKDIEIVVDLSIPAAHAELNRMALQAGKHVYVEKPLTVVREDAAASLELARQKGLLVGCAPDTVLGAGIQTCRRLIDAGKIGRVVSATAHLMARGHEHWHPNPEFYYKRGGGPMLDMGPYYLSALVTCIGPMRRVSGMTGMARPERTITSEKKYGQKIEVETPTHVTGNISFDNGAIGTIITSFGVCKTNLKWIEIHGTEGSLQVPDPNGFGGEVRVFRTGQEDCHAIEIVPDCYTENSRGIGVADMALAILQKRAHRASGAMAAHVLDAMLAFEESSDSGQAVDISLSCKQPPAMPAN